MEIMKTNQITYIMNFHHSDCADDPSDCGIYEFFSFNSRHVNFKHPNEFGLCPGKNGDPYFSIAKFRNLYKRGLIYILSCYQHSGIVWSMKGEGPQCQFDTAQVAGLICLNETEHKRLRLKRREEIARSYLKEYNQYINGEVYGFTIEEKIDEDGEETKFIDSCGGYYDAEQMIEDAFESIPKNQTDRDIVYKYEGDAKFLIDQFDLRKYENDES